MLSSSKAPARRGPKLRCHKPFFFCGGFRIGCAFTGRAQAVCHPAIGQMTTKGTPLQASPAKYPCRYSFCCRLIRYQEDGFDFILFGAFRPEVSYAGFTLDPRAGKRAQVLRIWFSLH